MVARQALYHLNHTSSPFCSGYFGARVLLFAQASLDYNPPILCFLLYLGWQVCATIISYWLRWRSRELFALNRDLPISASQIARIIGMSHRHSAFLHFVPSCEKIKTSFFDGLLFAFSRIKYISIIKLGNRFMAIWQSLLQVFFTNDNAESGCHLFSTLISCSYNIQTT
jgi:hypothetical protein